MIEKVLLTAGGEKKMRARLKRLREVERPKNIRDIEDARAHGDLSENAEYHAAKERQGMIDVQMRELDGKLSRCEIIDPSRLSGSKVIFGATVVLDDLDNEQQVTYQVVGTDEADPSEGRISYTAPLGRALLGKEAGDYVEVKAPAGIREYEVVEVRFE